MCFRPYAQGKTELKRYLQNADSAKNKKGKMSTKLVGSSQLPSLKRSSEVTTTHLKGHGELMQVD